MVLRGVPVRAASYGEYFASIDELIEAGQDESQYVIGERKRNGDYHVVVNGKSVPKQFAIYANHQPSRKANNALRRGYSWLENYIVRVRR